MGLVRSICFAGLVLILAIGSGGGTAPAESVRVGILLPLTGEQADSGEIGRRSFEMAAEEINAKGGINGARLELLFEDDAGMPDVGRSAVEMLISREQVSVLTGGYSSSVAAASTAVAQQFRVPFLVTAGSADWITERGYDCVFRINPTFGESRATLVAFLREVARPKSAVILYERSLYGQSRAKGFEEECRALEIPVLAKEGYDKGDVDFRPLLTKVKVMNPDLVYLVFPAAEAAMIMRQARELNLNPKLFLGEKEGFTPPSFRKDAGDAAEFAYSTTLWTDTVPYPGAGEYSRKYRAKYNRDADDRGAAAYASMYVVAGALLRAKSTAPDHVREALAQTDMMTAFGPVKFVSYGRMERQNRLPALLVQWQKGNLETVWPETVSSGKYVYPVPKWTEHRSD